MRRYVGANVFGPPPGLDAEHGWFTANGQTRFGPLPKREVSREVWPAAAEQRMARSEATREVSAWDAEAIERWFKDR